MPNYEQRGSQLWLVHTYSLIKVFFSCEQNNGWKDVYWINITSVTKNQLERFIHVSINFGSKIYSRKKKTNFERKHISLFVCIRFVSSLVHLFVKKAHRIWYFFAYAIYFRFSQNSWEQESHRKQVDNQFLASEERIWRQDKDQQTKTTYSTTYIAYYYNNKKLTWNLAHGSFFGIAVF